MWTPLVDPDEVKAPGASQRDTLYTRIMLTFF